MVRKKPSTASISDFYTTVVLHAAGGIITSINLDPATGRVFFEFDDTDGVVTDTLMRHRAGQLLLSSLAFVSSATLMKSLIHDQKRQCAAGGAR